MRVARSVARVMPLPSVAVEITSASMGLLLRGCGHEPRARGSRMTVTVVPERTRRLRTEASPALWVTVVDPARQPGDVETVGRDVAVSLGGDDGVPGGAVTDGDAGGEAG